jgi:hypothetical protein
VIPVASGWVYIDVGWHLRTGEKRGFPRDEGPEVLAVHDPREGGSGEERGFDDVQEAVAWGRARARLVLVRLGPSDQEMYSAGEALAYRGTNDPFPEWPPPGGDNISRFVKPS